MVMAAVTEVLTQEGEGLMHAICCLPPPQLRPMGHPVDCATHIQSGPFPLSYCPT